MKLNRRSIGNSGNSCAHSMEIFRNPVEISQVRDRLEIFDSYTAHNITRLSKQFVVPLEIIPGD